MVKIQHIVFYGTLMANHQTAIHEALKDSLVFESACIIPGQLYSLGSIPALKPGNQRIRAELYKIINPEILPMIDAYEAVDNDNPTLPGFTRKSIQLLHPKLHAWVYYYDGSVSDAQLIAANAWKAWAK